MYKRQGAALAAWDGKFNLLIFGLVLVGSVAIHAGTNLINDYYDWRKGTDTAESLGPNRPLKEKLVTPRQVLIAGLQGLPGLRVASPSGQALGLARDETRGETEDHIAGVFEVMRYLIAGDDAAVCNLEQQRRFFRGHLQPWIEKLCDAVDTQPRAQLYRALADFTRAFVQVETQGFDLLEQ